MALATSPLLMSRQFRSSLATLWRATPASLASYVSRGQWDARPRHLRLMSQKLATLMYRSRTQGIPGRLIVQMPPRHGKSSLISHWTLVWAFENWPDISIILCSYEADFAARWGRKVRDTIDQYGPKRGGPLTVELDPSSTAASRWATTAGGEMVAVGAGGPITGRGAHLLIVDDPIKNGWEAHSEAYRERLWEWWTSTAYTRLEPGAVAVIVMTRWHTDDLVGRILREAEEDPNADQWEVLSLPAIAEPPPGQEVDAVGRRAGEPLWPERFDEKELLKIRRSIGEYNWSALYQQRPSPAEGGILKRSWWKFYKQPPDHFDEIIQSWDMTFKDTKGSDYVVGQVWGRKGANKYLLDQVRDRMDFPKTVEAFLRLTEKWPQAAAKLVEDKANGPAVIATLQSRVPGIIPVQPQGSKEARVHAVTPDIEAGNVYLPEPSIAPWVKDFIEECAAFPNGAFDDQVDAMSQALLRFMNRKSFVLV